MNAARGKGAEAEGDHGQIARRRFVCCAAVGSLLVLVTLNGAFFWKLTTAVPHSTPLDLSRQSQRRVVELRGLFPGRYHLAIEFSIPENFEDTKSFYRGSGAERIHQDLDVDLELLLTDENGRSLLEAAGGTRGWKIYNRPHLEHADGGLENFSFEASPFHSYSLRTAVLRASPSAAPYRASLLLYAEGIEYLGIKAAIYNSLLLIVLIMVIVLVWAYRFGEADEDIPSLS
ncbi:MAG: hypothetical protein GY937_25035 [bacterium]|nr:hypothetical protein [bacterium]